jgi:hypothetical protein
MKYYCLILLFSLLGSSLLNAQECSATLDRNEIKIGEQVHINLEVRFSAAKKVVMMPQLQDTITKFIDIVEVSNIDTTFDEDNITTKIFTQRVAITSWDSGFHAIPPFIFTVDGDTIKTEPLLLSVNSVAIEAEQDIKDIKNIAAVPFSLWDWILSNRLLIGEILLLVFLIVVGIILYKRYTRRPIEETVVEVPKEAADIVALKKLDELQNKKLWQAGKVKNYYTDLSFIIREYLENRYVFPALEYTTDEILYALKSKSSLDRKEEDKLLQLLQLADMAKFAKQQPMASENDMALKIAYHFIETTKIVVSELDQKETSKVGSDA